MNSSTPDSLDLRRLNRRAFLSTAAKGLGAAALLSNMPKGWSAPSGPSDAPETTDINFGMIALTDCSPIVIAHEKGLFKKYGINSKVTKGANWAAIRDQLTSDQIHGDPARPMVEAMGMPISMCVP